jgi:hypothetical protein
VFKAREWTDGFCERNGGRVRDNIAPQYASEIGQLRSTSSGADSESHKVFGAQREDEYPTPGSRHSQSQRRRFAGASLGSWEPWGGPLRSCHSCRARRKAPTAFRRPSQAGSSSSGMASLLSCMRGRATRCIDLAEYRRFIIIRILIRTVVVFVVDIQSFTSNCQP